jgi:putative addiction module component (TIGR02574 family)
MSVTFKQVVENIKSLSAGERALVAHCLISSLETTQENGVDEAWADLAEQRYLALQSGAVQGLSWEEIKNEVKKENVC